MEACPAFAGGFGYAPDILAALDCKVDILARSSFGALTASGSPAMVMLGGMMTLLVAFYGYRLILGGRLDFGDTMVSIVKIGLVLAFVTQWPAYQAVFYDVAIKGPQEILARLPFEILDDPAQYPERVQASYDQLMALETPQAIIGAGSAPATAPPTSDPYAAAQLPRGPAVTYGDFFAFRPASAALFLLFPELIALALPRLIAGLLLALGPLFIGFLLFEGTKSIFFGWVRMLAWSILAGTIATILIGIEVSIVEPQITQLVADLNSGASRLPKTGELIATALLFACLLAGGLVAAIAPTRLASLSVKVFSTKGRESARPIVPDYRQNIATERYLNVEVLRSRAQLIGDRMALAVGNDERVRQPKSVSEPGRIGERIQRTSNAENIAPLGQRYRRNAPSRRTPNAVRRNGRR